MRSDQDKRGLSSPIYSLSLKSHGKKILENLNILYKFIQVYLHVEVKLLDVITFQITKVIQNNTGIYTKESSQQTFKIPTNSNFDVRFEKAYRNHNNEILNTTDQKGEQDKPQLMMVKFQNEVILMHRMRFDQFQVTSAVL